MRRIGRYELLDEVARGGAGVVHRARAPGGQVVAVKVLLAGAGAPPVARQRFLTEGRLLARLRHPGVLRVHEVGEEGGCQFLVMDLLEGASLQDRLDRAGPFPPRAAAALVRDLARALQHVHEAGVLHRDVKPANALLAATGAVVLTDFGLGKDLLAAAPGPSVTGQLLGSPGFWAPEQAAGETRRMGPRTDVFGAGATLFALLTGSPPNRGEGLAELLEAMTRPPPPPSRLAPGIDAGLDAVCARCLARDPDARYPTAAALADDLDAWLARREPPRRRRALALVAPGLAALALVLGLAAWRGTSAPPAVDEVDADGWLVSATAALERGAWSEAEAACVRALALRPDDPAALRALARSLARQERLAEALARADRVVALAPASADAWLERAGVKVRLGDHAGAVDDFTRALERDPRLAAALRGRALARIELRADGAEEDLSAALALDPQDVAAWRARAKLRDRRGAYAAALEDYGRALELAPDDAETCCARGLVHGRAGDLRSAVADFDRALALEPTLVRAWAGRGYARHQLGEPHAALPDLDQALALRPDQALYYAYRGDLRLTLGDLDGAVTDLTRAIELDPRHLPAWANRARARCALGDHAGAAADYEAAADRVPPDDDRAPHLREYAARERREGHR